MNKRINIETYESPKCEIVELLSKDPLLIPSLGPTGPGEPGHGDGEDIDGEYYN